MNNVIRRELLRTVMLYFRNSLFFMMTQLLPNKHITVFEDNQITYFVTYVHVISKLYIN